MNDRTRAMLQRSYLARVSTSFKKRVVVDDLNHEYMFQVINFVSYLI